MEYDFTQMSHMAIFEGIKKEDFPNMLKCLGSYQKSYSKNEIIFLESQDIQSIGIILSGTVHMIKEDASGNKTLIICMKMGELFGETFACANNTSTHVSFVAASSCKVLFIPFYKVINSCTLACTFHHRLIENMVRLISKKNLMLMNKVEIVSKKTLRDKILCYLAIESENFKSNKFTIPLGRVELAEYLCADRSALTRELSSMQNDGLITYNKNTFTLL